MQAKLAEALNAKREQETELQMARVALEAERAAKQKLEQSMKDKEFEVFKQVMDVATQDREALGAEIARLKQLLESSVADIMALNEQNVAYKAELDMRRTVMGDFD